MPFDLQQPLPSPCRGICKLDASREHCIGCLRTVEEIRDWPNLNNQGRLEILDRLKARRDSTGNKTNKRQNRRRRMASSA